MTTHLTARLSWHMDGWNGRVCQNPSSNHYCVGSHSYPGDKIKQGRDLKWENEVAGQACADLDRAPPCIYSLNAFGTERLTAFDDPPTFFPSGERTYWPLPPATVCVWPYEAMYDDDAKSNGRVDNDKRLVLAKEFFNEIEPDESLVFHYANYSNPFSEEDANRYVVVGLSRVKKLGQITYYEGTDEETKDRFGGAYAWQMNVETHYPDQGLRIPYHRYMDNPEVLERITFVPENSRCFKYGSRHVSDDDALSLIERFIEITSFLNSLGDESENWSVRLDWLNSLISELWHHRGLYPGLARVFDLIGLSQAVEPFRQAVANGNDEDFRAGIFAWLDGKADKLPGFEVEAPAVAKARREWELKPDDERHFISEILPRFDLPRKQMERILASERSLNGLEGTLSDLAENPYQLSEQFVGDDPDDVIHFSRIDHGMLPSPDLGGNFLCEVNDARRLRALCVDRLKFETKHSFMTCGQMLQDVNRRIATLPEWKRVEFTDRYIEVDRDTLREAIVFRSEEEREYAYLKRVFDAERNIEQVIRRLVVLPDITFKSPVTAQHWKDLLREPSSTLAAQAPSEYENALSLQAEVCQKIFNRPISVVCGAAGTGKTTVIAAILLAIEKAHGPRTSFRLLAPTGKAADRIREKTGKDASTIHSFLAHRGWLNDNLTLKQAGGSRDEETTTFVIDEASMLDLELTSTLFKAIRWNSVQRLILVGDANQLPPIGRGKVFADVIDWLRANYPDSVGELTVNLRQMANQLEDKGTGILNLASLYARASHSEPKNEENEIQAESIFQRLQDLPPNGAADKDLRVIFWDDSSDLMEKLVSQMRLDMEEDSGESFDPEAPHSLWLSAPRNEVGGLRPDYHQVITPYRHEDFGTEAINLAIQQEARSTAISRIGLLDGITLFDKVLQYRNRGVSDAIWAYNSEDRENQPVSIYNGELGFVVPHGMDGKKWKGQYFRLDRFQVRFSRKEKYAVAYGNKLGYAMVNDRKKWLPNEKPEDNLELAYAISVHKAQGSEFDRVYFVVPKEKLALLSPELFYTGVTRASRHCTIFLQQDISTLLRMYRPESSHLVGINSSIFDFAPVPDGFEQIRRQGFLEEYKIHRTLADLMVRSKSEVIIANILFERDINFFYEKPLYAPDGSFYLPDFTILHRGEEYYWEHLGLLEQEDYQRRWEVKKNWYKQHFPDRLVTTEESGELSSEAAAIVDNLFT